MKGRKPTKAEQIAELSSSIDTKEIFVNAAIKKANELNEARKARRLTKAELKNLDDLADFIHESTVWLIRAKEEVLRFHKPA